MNQLADLQVTALTANSILTYGINSSSTTATNCLAIADDITLGSHTFKAEQLGQLFNLLLSQYPELSL